jgi:uncharacterized protein YecE (DUF72 family)
MIKKEGPMDGNDTALTREERSGMLSFGTCSWKYRSWAGLVYSAETPENYLAEYAEKYSSVEVDQWFWSLFPGSPVALPRELTVKEYAVSVPPEFRFTIKVPNSVTLTHYYSRGGTRAKAAGKQNGDAGAPNVPEPNPYFLSEPVFRAFLEKLGPISDRIGALMFQFEYLNRQKMKSLDEFLSLLERFFAAVPREHPYAIEPRNPAYLTKRYFEFLHANGLSHVFLQGYYMPPVQEVFRDHGGRLVSPVIVRLLGTDREAMEEASGDRWNGIIAPKDRELSEIVPIVRNLIDRDIKVYLNVNNHYEGSAPLTIEKIREMLGRE